MSVIKLEDRIHVIEARRRPHLGQARLCRCQHVVGAGDVKRRRTRCVVYRVHDFGRILLRLGAGATEIVYKDVVADTWILELWGSGHHRSEEHTSELQSLMRI